MLEILSHSTFIMDKFLPPREKEDFEICITNLLIFIIRLRCAIYLKDWDFLLLLFSQCL